MKRKPRLKKKQSQPKQFQNRLDDDIDYLSDSLDDATIDETMFDVSTKNDNLHELLQAVRGTLNFANLVAVMKCF